MKNTSVNNQVKKNADPSEYLVELQFSISDTGCEINPDQKEEIFQPFTQGEDYMTREHEGVR